MKVPRDLSSQQLIKSLKKYGYIQTRQVGSHIRLTITMEAKSEHITIPNHNPIKVGTLNNILKQVSLHLKISKDELMKELK